MNKSELLEVNKQKFQNLFDFLDTHENEKWNQGPENKWTTGQHILHLVQSAKPLNRALGMPMFLLWYKFGKANRPPRTYAEVEDKYKTKLAKAPNIVSPFSKNMPTTPPNGKQAIIDQLKKEEQVFLKKVSKLSEKNLDTYLIPHPLMGRMIIREIVMWNACHVEHHHLILQDRYT